MLRDDVKRYREPTTGASGLFRLGLLATVAIALVGACLLGAAVLTTVWFIVGRPTVTQINEASPAAVLEALKIAAGFVVGVGGVVALVVAYRKQRVGEDENRRHNDMSARDLVRLFNERFARASEQLGSERAAIRLAGIHAMAGLADDWSEGRQVCIDVLCAYLRMPFRPLSPIPEYERTVHRRPRAWELFAAVQDTEGEEINSASEAHVRSTVLQVFRDRLWEDCPTSWAGAHIDLTGAVLEDASFDGMDLTDCRLVFDDCLFIGECSFADSIFRRCNVSFLNAVFAGRLGFEYSKIEDSEITLYGDFTHETDVNFQGLTLTSGTLDILGPRENGGHLSFVGSQLVGGKINVVASLTRENAVVAFSRAVISGTEIRISGGEFTSGNIWCNGVDITGGSFVFGSERQWERPIKLEGTELSIDGAQLTRGRLAFERVQVAGSAVHLDDLDMQGGILDLASLEFTSGDIRFSNPSFSGGTVLVATTPQSGPLYRATSMLSEAGATVQPNTDS